MVKDTDPGRRRHTAETAVRRGLLGGDRVGATQTEINNVTGSPTWTTVPLTRNARMLATIPALAAMLSGCATHEHFQSSATQGHLLQVHGPGHVTYGLARRPGNCHVGGQLPNGTCTPGAIDPAVTQANLRETICKPGYTKTVRPPVNQTNAAKRGQYQAYDIPQGADSELDHLVPQELGAANDIANLWPEVGPQPNPKDTVERDLNKAVCSGKVQLTDAQQAIADDWQNAEKRLGVG